MTSIALFRPVRYAWRALMLSMAVLTAVPVTATAADTGSEHAAAELALVYKLLLFITWPAEDALAADSPLTLCIDQGSTLFALASPLDGHILRRMKLKVKPITVPAPQCNAIYVDTDASLKTANSIQGSNPQAPLLIIAGSNFYIQDVSTVQLIEIYDKLTFDISQKQARRKGLEVSSRLLRLARKVN